jgi:hypothetical protein
MAEVDQEEDRTRHQQEPRTAYEPTIGPDGAMRRHDEHEYPRDDHAKSKVEAPFPTEGVLDLRRGAVVKMHKH